MSPRTVRPWGLLDWVLDRLPEGPCDFIGCIGPEDRSLAAWAAVRRKTAVQSTRMAAIRDPDHTAGSSAAAWIAHRVGEFHHGGGRAVDVVELTLFCRVDDIMTMVDAFATEAKSGRVVIDVSSFPKRFFFPIVRRLMMCERFADILVTYTVPRAYTTEPLAANPEPWRNLPLFLPRYPEPKNRILLIGIGFEPLGLPDLLQQDYNDVPMQLLFPFPPGPPHYQRTWEFVRTIEPNLPDHRFKIVRLDPRNVSDVFDHLNAASDHGKIYPIMAPFGPKTMSLAMCIFGTLTEGAAYYTQPRVYSAAYSSGVAELDGRPEIYTYCLKLGGRLLYAV